MSLSKTLYLLLSSRQEMVPTLLIIVYLDVKDQQTQLTSLYTRLVDL